MSMRKAVCLLVVLSGVAFNSARAQGVGEVSYVEGVGTVQQQGGATRILGRGVVVNQGDVITTAPKSFAIVRLADGTAMTLRPSTQLAITHFDFKPQTSPDASVGSMVLSLLRGGLRTVTGLIPKRNLDAARINTPSATIGIRGTEMDTRLCKDDSCFTEMTHGTAAKPRAPNVPLASARVARIEGRVTVRSVDGKEHLIGLGASVYAGDTVVTGPASYAVLGFRDQSRVTVQPATQLKVEDFVFDDTKPEEGRFLLNLIKGGLRAITGIVGSANHDHVSIRTASATIGIRGTGGDAFEGDGGFQASTWEGTLVVKENATGAELEMALGVTVAIESNGHLHTIPVYTHAQGPRPDTVVIDWAKMWARQSVEDHSDGLWVQVITGPVHVVPYPGGENGAVDSGSREIVFCDAAGSLCVFPAFVPPFFNDETPDPLKPLRIDLISEIKPSGIDAVCSH